MKCVADEISGSRADLSAEAPDAIVLEGGLLETPAELRTLSDELVEFARRRLPKVRDGKAVGTASGSW